MLLEELGMFRDCVFNPSIFILCMASATNKPLNLCIGVN